MAKKNRLLWKYCSVEKDGRRRTQTEKPPESRVASGKARAYGDFRDYSEYGGGIEALIVPGETSATTDPDIAEHLIQERLEELKERKFRKVAFGIEETKRLKEYVAEHLESKAKTEDVTERWLATVQNHLEAAIEHFGANRELSSIRTRHVRDWIEVLLDTDNGRGGTLSKGTVRHYLNSLSNLYRRALEDEIVVRNPVANLMEKPQPEQTESDWLEAHEMALLLEASRVLEPDTDAGALDFIHPLVATFALTGARKKAVLGLRREDIDLERKTVRFRPNQHRRLKTSGSNRTVPLWPQLEEILRPHLLGETPQAAGLIFPSPRGDGRSMLHDIRKQLDAVGELAGFEEGRIRTKIFRHSYCAARLQTLDDGHPVSPYTVARELGHSSTRMVDRVYGHLGNVRNRSEEVEFRVSQHEDRLEDELKKLRKAA